MYNHIYIFIYQVYIHIRKLRFFRVETHENISEANFNIFGSPFRIAVKPISEKILQKNDLLGKNSK